MIQAGKVRGSSATTAIAVMKRRILFVQPRFSVGRPAGCFYSIFLGQMKEKVKYEIRASRQRCFCFDFRSFFAFYFPPNLGGFLFTLFAEIFPANNMLFL